MLIRLLVVVVVVIIIIDSRELISKATGNKLLPLLYQIASAAPKRSLVNLNFHRPKFTWHDFVCSLTQNSRNLNALQLSDKANIGQHES